VFRQRGYKVLDLNLSEARRSGVGFDPLRYCRTEADIANLANAIVWSGVNKESFSGDPFWNDTAAQLLRALIVYAKCRIKNPTFNTVIRLFDRIQPDENAKTGLDDAFEAIKTRYPSCYSDWTAFRRLHDNGLRSVWGSLNTPLHSVFTPEVQSVIEHPNQLNIQKIGQEKTVLFLSSSPSNMAEHKFVNIFYAQLFKGLFEYAEHCEGGSLPVPVHVLCDDFACGSRILDFPQLISIFREKRISVTLLLQSESQLSSMYGKVDATTIINNCDSYVYLGSMDYDTASVVARRLDVPVNDVLWMPIGQEVLFRRGQKPIRTERYDIMHDRLYIEQVLQPEPEKAPGQRSAANFT
jgi:type IV secretory pathway TraG/TraD family ATPase VirD4